MRVTRKVAINVLQPARLVPRRVQFLSRRAMSMSEHAIVPLDDRSLAGHTGSGAHPLLERLRSLALEPPVSVLSAHLPRRVAKELGDDLSVDGGTDRDDP